jgi:hypothetical protein
MNHSYKYSLGREWLEFGLLMSATALITTAIFVSVAAAQPSETNLPDLSGSYSCEGDETACGWSGYKFTIIQKGATLEIRNEKGAYGLAKLTSPISLSAGPIWNMLGVIVAPGSGTIQWSNGTIWTKLDKG